MAEIGVVLLIGLVAGVAGGLFGLGGGAIMVPALVLIVGMSQKMATGTSLAAQILPIGLLGAAVYWRGGNMKLGHGMLLALGLLIGNLLGALFTNQSFVSDQFMKKAYGVFLLALGVRYLFWDSLARLWTK